MRKGLGNRKGEQMKCPMCNERDALANGYCADCCYEVKRELINPKEIKFIQKTHPLWIGGKFFVGTSLCILMLCGLFMVFMYSQNPQYAASGMFKFEEFMMPNDPAVALIADRCNREDTAEDKVYCVNDIVSSFFVYNKTSDFIVNTPTKTLTIGGVCRDSAVMYCMIFKEMDMICNYQTIDKHVFNVIDLGVGHYCVVDMEDVRCRY